MLLLPLFSLVYCVEQSDEKEEHQEDSIGDVGAIRQDECSALAVPITTTTTTTTSPGIVSKEQVISNEIYTESISNEAVSLNLNDAAVTGDLHDNNLAILNPEVVSKSNKDNILNNLTNKNSNRTQKLYQTTKSF